nr:MAG TPA: hypothetical protein [Caudoviricetes sp.]
MPKKGSPPALTVEGRENQLISLAVDQAEKQLREGTASSQVLVHYLKLASTREKREKEKMEAEIELLRAKEIAARAEVERGELYRKAVEAMRRYQGADDYPEDIDDGLY